MTTSRVVRTVRVVVHTAEAGETAIAILGSEHVGKRRVDLRIVPARRTGHRAADAPPGVPAPIWLAYCALADYVGRPEPGEVTGHL